MISDKKRCLIIIAIAMWVALLWVWIYYLIKEYKANHQVICSIEQWWDCPEDIEKCYERMKKPDSMEDCPAKEWACDPVEIEVCEKAN